MVTCSEVEKGTRACAYHLNEDKFQSAHEVVKADDKVSEQGKGSQCQLGQGGCDGGAAGTARGWRVGLKVAWDVETPAVAVPVHDREVPRVRCDVLHLTLTYRISWTRTSRV